MKFLIRMIAAAIARRLERGSPRGALLGTVLGVAAGAGVVLLLQWRGVLPGGPLPALIVACVLGGLGGGLIGAGTGVGRPSPAAGEAAAAQPVRITNFNAALAPLVICIVFACLLTVLLVGSAQASEEPTDWRIIALLAALAVASGVLAARSVLWIDIGPDVIVKRLVGRKSYSRNSIARIGLSGEGPGPPVTSAGPAHFVLTCKDGFAFETALRPALARRVAAALDGYRLQ